jgi:hypothetical protein
MIVNWARAGEWLAKPVGNPPWDLLNFVLLKGKARAPKAEDGLKKAVRRHLRKNPHIKTAQAAKKDLRKELEALCKAIVFTRDCGSPESRSGNCISCGKWNDALQWGHFIRQQDSKWLQYDPRNCGGQCAYCNGRLHGNVLKYAEAIDLRDGEGAAKALQREAEAYKDWRVNKFTLSQKYRELVTIARARGVPYSYSDAEGVGEAQPNRPDSSPVTPTPKKG